MGIAEITSIISCLELRTTKLFATAHPELLDLYHLVKCKELKTKLFGRLLSAELINVSGMVHALFLSLSHGVGPQFKFLCFIKLFRVGDYIFLTLKHNEAVQ